MRKHRKIGLLAQKKRVQRRFHCRVPLPEWEVWRSESQAALGVTKQKDKGHWT